MDLIRGISPQDHTRVLSKTARVLRDTLTLKGTITANILKIMYSKPESS